MNELDGGSPPMSTDSLEEYWERRRLEEERKAQRLKARSGRGNATLPLGKARAEKAKGRPCRVCAIENRHNTSGVEAHHIVHRARITNRHPLVHHPDNILPVCHAHHQDHHSTARRIPLAALTEAEAAFLVKHGGEAWARRWYPTT